jgi:hypothetical protein
LDGISGEKRPPRKHRHRWEDIKMNLKEMGWDGLGWTHLVQNKDQRQAPVNSVKNLQGK